MSISRRTALHALAAMPLAAMPLVTLPACEPAEAQRPRSSRLPAWGGLRVERRGPEDAPLAVVLLHGFGARGDDLVSLGEALAARTRCRFIMPEAPLPMGPVGDEGRAWYRIDAADDAAQITTARTMIEGVIQTLRESRTPPPRIVLGGFSQGGIMSIEVALRGQAHLAGVAVLSGRSLPHPEASYRALSGLPVFASHGRNDSVIPIQRGQAFMAQASSAGALVERVIFEGEHAIPPVVLSGLAGWLEALRP